jgi:hypothetical protein
VPADRTPGHEPGDGEPTEARDVAHDLELRLVRALEQLPGVLGAAVWLADLQRVRAVHITAAPHASGLIISRAVGQILRRHALQFSPDQIRVAFRDDADTHATRGTGATAAPGTHRFLVLRDFSVTRSGSRVLCRVNVARGEHILDGEASELDTEAGRARAAARATLVAAEKSENRLALGLEGTLILDMFGRRYVAASVEAAIDRRFALLAGLVPIDAQRSLEEAACLAALHAIDRWIAW